MRAAVHGDYGLYCISAERTCFDPFNTRVTTGKSKEREPDRRRKTGLNLTDDKRQ